MDIQKVINEVKKYINIEEKIKEIEIGYIYAKEKHNNQFRKSGEPYILHPLWTAHFLAQWRMPPDVIIAGLLHDILEDTPVQYEELKEKFSEDIANIVESVTKVSYFAKANRRQIKSQYLRKLYLSMAKDIRVIIVKLADRLHNLKTISFLKESKRQEIAKESLEIYASIAKRIGMHRLNAEIEDICFEIINPTEYSKIKSYVENNIDNKNIVLNAKYKELYDLLWENKKIDMTIKSREKHIYSIYKKMVNQGKALDDIHDIIAFRIIANSIDDCYLILGYVHQNYLPITNRFKDYIASPKSNLYQSLHTTVACTDSTIMEVQIRTKHMDEVAEEGVASHWKYKESEKFDNKKKQLDIDEKLDIFRNILEYKNNAEADPQEEKIIARSIQEDVFTNLVYALTPKGTVITLPFGSTILDFAYRIHSNIGETTIGAKINGVFSSINTIIKSGDIVDVKTAKNQHPKHSWLLICKTTNAKSKIKKYLRKNSNNDNEEKETQEKRKIKKIKKEIEDYIVYNKLKYKINSHDQINYNLNKLGVQTIEEMILNLINKNYDIKEIVNLIYLNKSEELDQKIINDVNEKNKNIKNLKYDIIIPGVNYIKASLSSCCFPIPFNNIIGYISRFEGVKVHHFLCKNIKSLNKEKFIDVEWNMEYVKKQRYEVKINISCWDRKGIIADITKIIANFNVSIQRISTQKTKNIIKQNIRCLILISNEDVLKKLIINLKNIPNVDNVKRVGLLKND